MYGIKQIMQSSEAGHMNSRLRQIITANDGLSQISGSLKGTLRDAFPIDLC